MPIDLFGAPTGAEGVNLESGSPEYQDAVVSQATRSLKPAYMSALKGLRQNYASRGMLESGLLGQGEQGLAQDYLGQLGNISTQAATRGADVSEENRRRQETRGWQVEDRNLRLQQLEDEANAREEAQNGQLWSNLIGGVAGVGGALLGSALGPGGAMAGQAAGNAVGGRDFIADVSEAKANLSGYGDMDFEMDPELSAYGQGGLP